LHVTEVSVAVASNASGKVHILLLNGDALGMDGAKVGVLEETNDVGLGSLLEGLEGNGLEAEGVVHVHGDASDKSLEGSSWEEHIGSFLVSLDLSKGNSSWLVSKLSLFFHATGGRGRLLHLTTDCLGHLGGSLGFSGNFGFGHCVCVCGGVVFLKD